MIASTSAFALTDGNVTVENSTLACGNAILSVQTTYFYNSYTVGDQVLNQRLIWKNIKKNQQKELETDGKYVIKHIPDGRKVLDAAFDTWGCIKSKYGKYYFYLFYYCTAGEEKGFCAQGKVEFERILQEDGTPLIKIPRHWRIRRMDEDVYKSLGLYDAIKDVQVKDIRE